MKLELKHLAPYLPYSVHLMNEYERWHNTTLNKGLSIYQMLEMKPILRPLSDLHEDAEGNKHGLSYIDIIGENHTIECCEIEGFMEFPEEHPEGVFIELKYLPYEVVSMLFKYHFDVFGLIDAGLAIDINTLDK